MQNGPRRGRSSSDAHSQNKTQTGLPMVTLFFVSASRPVAGSTRKTTTSLVSRLAQSSQLPSGERAKLRGCFPPQGTISTSASRPVCASRAKTAMLSCPRLEA